jgi:hypothetical protein
VPVVSAIFACLGPGFYDLFCSLETLSFAGVVIFANQPIPALDARFELLVVKQLWNHAGSEPRLETLVKTGRREKMLDQRCKQSLETYGTDSCLGPAGT